MEEFDYVVVGGGSAGCVVASRLSEDAGVTVCLLEAGGEGRDVLIRAPLGFAVAMPRGVNSWNYETVPQPGFNGRRGFQPRGKTLGGSMAVVDAQLRVRGVGGLRIADASVMPRVTSNNINAAVIMIGEKCADMIRRDS